MKKDLILSLLTGFSVAAFCGGASATLLIEANFDVAPPTEDPTWIESGAWSTDATLGTSALGGESVAIYNTIDNNSNVSIITPTGSMTAVRSIVARMRVLDDDGYNGDGTSINFINNGYFFTVGIVSEKPPFHPEQVVALSAGSPNGASPLDTANFHEIGLNITDLATGKFDVYVDGVPVLTDRQAFFGGPGFDGQLQFGDNAGTPDAQAELDWIRAYDTPIPEPSMIALLGLGGLALFLRRRS